MLHVNVIRCMVNKNATTGVHFFGLCLASGGKQSTLGAANIMVNGDFLTWVKVVRSNDSLSISYGGSSLAWRGSALLLSKLACRAFRRTGELGGGLMEATGPFRVTQSSGSHQTLNLFEGKVA